MSSLDVSALRADTPGCEERVHLNNAGASLMPQLVVDAVSDHFDLETRIGGYEAAAEAEGAITQAYWDVGQLIGAPSDRIAFTEHATAAFVTALSSIRFERDDVLLTTLNDYVSNQIQYLSLEDRLGIEIVHAPDAPEGGVDIGAMKELIHKRRPKLVAVTHVPTNSGLVQDVTAVGRLCRERDILYLVDGCQSVGQMPIDVTEIGCDFFSATARKYLRGPRGAGFLYVSDRVFDQELEPLFPDLRGADWVGDNVYQPAPDARRFETWEFAWALPLGTGAAARYATETGLEAIRDRARSLAARIRERFAGMDGATVLDRGPELSATVTVWLDGQDPAELVRTLRTRGINVGSQTRLDAFLDYQAKGTNGALRVSPHYFNDETDLDTFFEALNEITAA